MLVSNFEIYLLIGFFGFLFILNSLATYIVLNTTFKVKERRLYQIIFVWLIPYIGAMLTIYINKQDYYDQKLARKKSGFTDSYAATAYQASNHRGGR